MLKIIAWIEKRGYLSYGIYPPGAGRPRDQVYAKGEFSDTETLVEDFKASYDDLPDGNYKIVGSKADLRSASAEMQFTKGKESSFIFSGQKNLTKGMDLEKYKAEVREAMRNEVYLEFLKEEVKDLKRELADFKSDYKDMVKKIAAKFDELDGKEDGDLLDKVVEKGGKLMETYEAMKDFKLS